jgi:TIR domain
MERDGRKPDAPYAFLITAPYTDRQRSQRSEKRTGVRSNGMHLNVRRTLHMVDVFISYAHKDFNIAQKLHAELGKTNTTWRDIQLEPGKPWAPQIDEKLGEAQIILVIWTENSIKRD